MSDLTFSIEKIAGAASNKSACGIFNKRISHAEGLVGTFVGCVIAKTGDSDASGVIGDMLELSASKLDGMEGSILENLERVRDVSAEFASSQKVEVSFAYAFFYENVCYIVRLGNRVKVQVFDSSGSVELPLESGSGPARPGQIYLLATEKFISDFDTAVLGGGDEIDFADVIDGLATEVSAKKDQGEIAAVFVQVGGEETEVKEDVEDTDDIEDIEEESVPSAKHFSVDRQQTRFESTLQTGFVKGGSIKSISTKILAAIVREFKRLRGGELAARGRLRRNIVILALVIFLILAGSGAYTLFKNQQKNKLAEFEAHLATAASRLNEGTAIIDLNRARARELLVEADREVKLALNIDGDSERAKSIEAEISGKLKETEVSANINFGTVAEVDGDFNSLSQSGKSLVAAGGAAVFEIDLSAKSAEKISDVTSAISSYVYDNKAFILTDTKVLRLDLASRQQEELFDQSGGQDIGVFLGNIYLLTKDKINKYVPVESGYSGPSDYFSESSPFGDRSRFAIDGLIWVTSGDKVLKFNRGEKEDFEISGLSEGVGKLGVIYTTSSLDNLYVIDATNSALLVVGKDGNYQKAYQAAEFSRASDLVVFDDEAKVYISVGNKILEASL